MLTPQEMAHTLPNHRHADSARYAALLADIGRDGDGVAMEKLLTDVQALAYRFSLLVCGNAADAEDAMQDALLQTYKSARRIRKPDAFRTWLYRTVKNSCLMSRRTGAHEPSVKLSLDDEGATEVASSAPNPEEQTAAARERRRFQAAFTSLPRPFRLVAFLRDVEGLSTREVAEVVGISEDNVKQRLHRARTLLRKALA
ncbi:MAG: RNA polymerase sigma factor [Vicinamibacterales bacterium]